MKATSEHYEDKLMIVKFQFFKDIPDILSPFLKIYQTDPPMMPFLNEDLEELSLENCIH